VRDLTSFRFKYLILFFFLRYKVKICGSDGLLIAMLMAIAQHNPTAPIPFLPAVKMQVIKTSLPSNPPPSKLINSFSPAEYAAARPSV
jgi:hypothetical protein